MACRNRQSRSRGSATRICWYRRVLACASRRTGAWRSSSAKSDVWRTGVMAVLITGAAGFVALNVAEHLLRAGREVVGLDRIPLPERARREFAALPGRFTLIDGTILSADDMRRALNAAPIDTVIHCAVITAGAAREKADPETIVAVN